MKKKILFFLIIVLIPFNIKANDRQIVSLNKCVDGDTAWFNLNGEKIKTRFLAINTPESTISIEQYGKEASLYTCSALKEASLIEIEYDTNSLKFDKYDRHLVWVFIDNLLLQDILVKEGYAEMKYIYGDYKYLEILNESQTLAKNKKLNIWSDYKEDNTSFYITICVIIIFMLLLLFSKKFRKKTIRSIKTKANVEFKKLLNNIFK